MKITSIGGAATTTRTATLHMLTKTAAGRAPADAPVLRQVAMAPPPRASSFGGADPRAMFEALVQFFDSDGDGKLSLGEVNALNQGGLLARNFARIDSNADGRISGDEIAERAPWGGTMLPSGDQSGDRGADIHPLFDKLTDHLNANRDAAISAENRAIPSQTHDATGFDPDYIAQTLARLDAAAASVSPDPATMMESMVLALSNSPDAETGQARSNTVKQIYTLP